MKLTLPIKAVNGSNERVHWATKAKRAKAQRQGTQVALRGVKSIWARIQAPVIVTLTRVAPRALDDDGAVTSLKHCRDGVADALGLPNDRDPRVTWRYAQRRGKVREYAVEVEILPRNRCECFIQNFIEDFPDHIP